MLTLKQKKQVLLAGIFILSLLGFSVVNSLDKNLVLQAYGLLFVCQIGFLLFFLNKIFAKGHANPREL